MIDINRGIRILPTIVVLVAILAACNLQRDISHNPTSTPAGDISPGSGPSGSGAGSATTPVSAPTQPPADPHQAVVTALGKLQTAGPYRVRTIYTGPDGKTINAVVEVVPPDRYHIMSSIGEFILVGSMNYMNQNGTWVATPAAIAQMISGFIQAFSTAGQTTISNAADAGQESADGIPSEAYKFTINQSMAGVTVPANARLWVDRASGLPVKQTISANVLGQKSEDTQDFTFDSSIKVILPTATP